MSHPLYNPYAAGNQSSNQPPYGHSSLQSGVDLQRQISGLGPGSSFSSSALSSATPANPGGRMSTLLAPSAGYRPEQRRAPVDEDLERSIDMHVSRAREGHISGHGPTSSFRPSAVSSATPANSGGRVPPLLARSESYRPEQSRAGMGVDVQRSKDMHSSRAREDVRLHGKQDYQPTGHSALFTSTQRDVALSSGTGRTSYPMASTSASRGPRHSDVDSGSSSLDWLTKYRKAATDDSSKLYPSPASSSYTSSKFNSSSDRVRDVQSIPGLGDFDYPVQDEPPTETSRPKYTSESASNILLQFGLEKDDLEYLISYPEDQITPANLPFILRQIRHQKAKRPSTAVEPKTYPETQPIRGVRARDSLSSSGGSPAVLQPTKVIEYGHTGKYVGGAIVDGTSGRTSGRRADSGSMSYDTYEHHSSSNRQEQLQKDTPEVKSSASSTSRVQTTNVSPSYTSSRSSAAPPSGDPAKRSQTKPNQTPQLTFNSFSLPKKDTETRVLTSEAAKPLAFKEPEDDRPSLSKLPQSASAALSPPGLRGVGVGNKTYPSGTQSKTQGQQSVVPEQTKKLQMQPKQKVQTPKVQISKAQTAKKAQTPQKAQAQQMQTVQTTQGAQTQPVPQTGNQFWTPVLPAGFLTPHQWDVFGLMTPRLVKLPGPAKLPTAAMMFDYAAASPRVFPHTCSLCHKECTSMTDWISHQNTSLHIGNCRNVRTLYPEWNGEIAPQLSAAANDAEPSPSASTAAKTSSQERHGSRSRSNSPRKKRSRSRSSRSSRYSRSLSRSRSPRYDRYRSRSRSHERWRGRDSKRSSSSSEERGGQRRSPRRRDDRRRSPRRSHPSPRRRSHDRRFSPSRRDDKPSTRMSRERWSPSEAFPDRRSGNAERLVKKLLENSAVQSLSAQSDLDAVVKSLTPALLAELAKMKSSPLSSKGGKKPDSPSSSSSSAKKPNMQKSEAEKSSTPTIVRLEGVNCSMSHGDLFAAVEHYGKTKSVLIIRSKREAVVCFENEEHARRLSNIGTITVKGIVIRVATKMMAQHKETPQKKPTIATKTNAPGRARPPTSLKTSPQEKKPLPAGATTKTVAKDLTKVTKAKTVATKPIANVAVAEPTRVSDVVSEVKVKEGTTSPARTTVKEEVLEKSAEPIEVTLKSTEVVRPPSAEADGPVAGADVKTPEASDEASSQLPQPESSAGPVLEVETGASQPSGSAGGTEENTTQEDPVSAVTRQRVPASAQDASQVVGSVTGAAAAAIESKSTATASCSSAKITSNVTCTLTIGEMADSLLLLKNITCCHYKVHLSQKSLTVAKRTLMIWNLPKYDDCPYTERDLVRVLSPHGFQYKDENIYVVPQSRLAFFVLPTVKMMRRILTVYKTMRLALKFCPLKMGSVKYGIEMSPIGFYNSLMRRMNSPVIDDGIRTIYIKNISPNEVRSLRETLRKIGSITNFLPLLNKVFVEFESDRDADRLGVWYGLLKRRPAYKLRRLNVSRCDSTALPPKMSVNAMPEREDIVAGAVVPNLKFGVPQGSNPPFLVTLRTDPYVFSTVSPWFIIPEYLSLKESGSIESANSRGSTPTIMLTALPEEGYSHEDVAKLVWPYFPQRDLRSLYYNVIVLPLQRRAFVHFSDWDTCRRFAQDHVAKTLFVQGHAIKIHFVLQNMFPESKEELLYTSLMRWSNAGVPDPVGLEERLICLEVYEMTSDLITMVMSVVQSIASFINFLPLANRICVEMSNSAGVARVLEKFNTRNTSLLGPKTITWKKVIGFVPLQSLKQRLEEANEIAIDLGVTPAKATLPPQPPPPAAGSRSVAARDMGPMDFTDDNITPDAYLFDDQNLTMRDFVTVDEVGSDARLSSHTKKARKQNRQHLALRSSLSSAPSSSANSSQSTKPTSSSSSSSFSQRKATESAVAVSNLRVAAEGTAAKSVQSEPGIETSSEMRPPAQGRASGSNRDQNLEGQTKKDDVVLVENEEGAVDEIIDLTQLLEPENGRVLNEENFQVLDSVSDDGEACPEAKSGEDGAAGNGSATGQEEGSGLVQRDGSTAKQLSEEDVILVVDRSDDKPALEEATVENQEANIDDSVQVSAASRRRASSGKEGAKKRKQKEISTESDKPLKQIPTEEERPCDVSDQKDVDEQETFKILDSIDDQTAMDDGGQKAETPGAQTSADKAEEEEEEEETYRVVDSVDDQPTTTEAESEADATARKEGGSSKRSGPRTRASKSEEKGKSPRKQDGTSQKSSEEGREIEEEVYQILDSIGDEPAQDVPATEKSVRRRSQRGKREDRTEASEKHDGDEETLYKVLDSVEDEAATEEPAVTTRPTRGRSGRMRRKDSSKEENTPTRRGRTPARESQERMTKNEGKASPTEEGEGAKKKSDVITVREARDEDATYEILDSVEDKVVVDLSGDDTQQETYEILDLTDKETKEDIVRVEEAEEEGTYQVVDSVDDQPTTVETEVKATAGKDGGSSKRTRPVRTVKTSKIVAEIDSVECERVQDVTATERSVRRRSQRGRKEDKSDASEKPDGDEEASYEILDSIEDDDATEEPTTTRSTRGRTMKKESPKKEATPTRRGRTPARESQQEAKRKSDVVTVRELGDEGATYEILDSVEDEEVVKEERPATGGRGRRGRPKKAAKATKKKTVTLKQSDKDEEEVSYQILDSVEGEMVDDPPPAEQSVSARKKKTSLTDTLVEKRSSVSGSPRNEEEEEEEEPVYQILDSVEGDQVQEESANESSKTEDETHPKEEAPAVEEDSPTCSRVVVEASQELVAKDTEDESGLEKKEDRSDARKEAASTLAEEEKKNPETTSRLDTASALVNLDEVSDEEEDYPDDTAEEEELRKRQATAKHKQLAKEREERKTGEREERQRRRRSSQSGGRKERGEGQEVKVDTEEQEREQEERKAKEAEEEEEDIKELMTLDEVGADEAGEEASEQGREWDGDITAEELQGLVTLDEIVEEEEEEGQAEQSPPELRPPSKEDESVDSLNPEGKTKNEAGGDEEGENRDEAETSLRSVKRKVDDDSEESANFVTVDEVEEEEEEEVKEAPRTRGRPRKKSRKTPVRKSTRGKKAVAEDERADKRESAGCDVLPLKDPSTSSGDCRPEIQKAEGDGASQAHVGAASAGQDPQEPPPESQGLEEGLSGADVTVVSKRTRAELVGPEAKRSRTRSPCSSADLKLPPFSPDNPLGQEFVVPRSGYFCNLCRVFYLNESTAKEQHCGSQRHYENLQKHYQKLEDEQSRRSSSTQMSQGSVSD